MSANRQIYDRTFFKGETDTSKSSATVIAPILMEVFSPNSVVDVGCGTGAFLAQLKKLGAKTILGIDGQWVPRNELLIEQEEFNSLDLSQEFPQTMHFDLAICLEVVEHLDQAIAERVILFLVQHSNVIFFSGAIPYQVGTHHITCRWPSFWQTSFYKHHFVPIDFIRTLVWYDARVAVHYRQNSIIYVHEDIAEDIRTKITSLYSKQILGQPVKDLIHPDTYLSLLEPRFSVIGRLFGLLQRIRFKVTSTK